MLFVHKASGAEFKLCLRTVVLMYDHWLRTGERDVEKIAGICRERDRLIGLIDVFELAEEIATTDLVEGSLENAGDLGTGNEETAESNLSSTGIGLHDAGVEPPIICT